MILYFVDRNQDVLGLASTNLSDSFEIIDDELDEDIDTGVVRLSASILWNDGTRAKLEDWASVGNYVLYERNNSADVMQIIDSETDTASKTVSIYAEDAGLDLLGEIVQPFTATEQHPIEWYISRWLGDSDFVIGVNEIPHLQRTLSWDGTSTATERIRSTATQFENCEISYSFEVRGMQIYRKYINIWESRGTDIQQELRLDRDINSFHIKTSISNLVTGLQVTGATPENGSTPITLAGYTYDDGDIYVDARGRVLSRSGAERWSRLTDGESFIVGTFSYETTSQSELCNRAVAYLNRYKEPEINYEVDIERGLENVRLGYRINLVDDKGGVYLSARVLALKISETANKKEATLGEYLIRDSGISEKVLELASRVQGLSDNPAYTLQITSSAGDVFIETTVKTTLTAHVFMYGTELSQEAVAQIGTINWYNYDNPSVILGTGRTYTIRESDNIDAINVTARLES